MSLGKLANLSEVIGRRRSVEVPKETDEKLKRSPGDQDYVLVEDTEPENEQNKAAPNAPGPEGFKSPAAVSLGLKVPSEHSSDEDDSFDTTVDTSALAAFRSQHLDEKVYDGPLSRQSRAHSLGLSAVPEAAKNGEEALQRALDQANQQHQWAMEAVIQDWQTEKKGLLTKLEKVIEARDTLEAELKHSEDSFANMLEGILDQKLDNMMNLLQENNLSRSQSLTASSFSQGSPTNLQNLEQVASELSGMLDALRNQQAAIEDRVSAMQSAVRQLMPAHAQTVEQAVERAQPRTGRLSRLSRPIKRWRQPLAGFAKSVRHGASRLQKKVSTGSATAAQRASSAIKHSAGASKSWLQVNSSRLIQFCHRKGVRREHLQALVCLLAGGVIASMLRSAPAKALPAAHKEVAVDGDKHADPAEAECEVLNLQEGRDEEISPLDQCVEIILNRNGVFKRLGHGPDNTSMVLAWPRISVEYN